MKRSQFFISNALGAGNASRASFLLLIAAILSLFPAVSVRADIGRKPSMEFSFEYEIEPVSIVEGKLIECDDAACETGKPLEQVGPQGFSCTESECSSLAYSYAPYHKLVITFTDRTRESNVFTNEAYTAAFDVIVSESALLVEEVPSGIIGGKCCCSGLLFTLILESLVASAYLSLFHLPRVILGWVPLSSLLSLPVVWFLFPQLALPTVWVTGLSEAFAILFETSLIYLAARGMAAFKHILALSLVMNSVSFLIGLLL